MIYLIILAMLILVAFIAGMFVQRNNYILKPKKPKDMHYGKINN